MSNTASEIKKGLETRLGKTDNFSLRDNYNIALYLYENSKDCKELVATAFNEKPYYNGPGGDLASKYKGKSFTRIAYEAFCDNKTIKEFNDAVKLKDKRLIIIPKSADFTRIDGMFIKYNDDTYLAFEALHSPKGNSGLIITGELAKKMFEYYSTLY